MSDDNQKTAKGKVIQFPGRRKNTAAVRPPLASDPKEPSTLTPAAPRRSRKNTAASVLAVVLATAAINNFIFRKNTSATVTQSRELASMSTGGVSRAIASVAPTDWRRDAKWEKHLAESLASAKVRDVASLHIGRPATAEERLRWGTLEEKYTITWRPDAHEINTILLQDESSAPAYILDRDKFLRDFGALFDDEFASAKLSSVQKVAGKTIEAYTLYDKDQHPRSEARFELDRHKRLISLKVEPSRI
jgi:hypothetical protein